MNRRSLITGLVSLIAAPAVIRTQGLIMPVKAFPMPGLHYDGVDYGAIAVWDCNGIKRWIRVIIDVQHEAHYGVGVRSTNWSLSRQTEESLGGAKFIFFNADANGAA